MFLPQQDIPSLFSQVDTTKNNFDAKSDLSLLNITKTIFEAARAGDLATLAWWVESQHADVNQRDHLGNTPLHIAAKYADVATLQWLIAHGADLNAVNTNKLVPVQMVIFYHANSPQVQRDKFNCLVGRKAKFGNLDFEKACNEELKVWPGAISDACDNKGHKLLHFFAALGRHDKLEALKKEYGDISLTLENLDKAIGLRRGDNDSNTPFLYAVLNGHLSLAQQYVREDSTVLNWDDNFGNTALMCAAMNNHLEMVSWLVKDEGRNVNRKNQFGYTALLLAAFHGHLAIVKWLLEEGGANSAARDRYGRTALMNAVAGGHLEIVKYLLQGEKAQLDEKNAAGKTAAMLAREQQHFGIAFYLDVLATKDSAEGAEIDLGPGKEGISLVDWNKFCHEVADLKITRLTVRNAQRLTREQEKQLEDIVDKASRQALSVYKKQARTLADMAAYTLWAQPGAKLSEKPAEPAVPPPFAVESAAEESAVCGFFTFKTETNEFQAKLGDGIYDFLTVKKQELDLAKFSGCKFLCSVDKTAKKPTSLFWQTEDQDNPEAIATTVAPKQESTTEEKPKQEPKQDKRGCFTM